MLISVVGYDTIATTNGNMGVGATFLNVSEAGTMADIKITGHTRPYAAMGIYCSLLDTFGRSIQRMYWFDHAASTKPKRPFRYGWYSDNGATCYNETVTIKPGEVPLSTSTSNLNLQQDKGMPVRAIGRASFFKRKARGIDGFGWIWDNDLDLWNLE